MERFSRGYAATSDEKLLPDQLPDWEKVSIGSYTFGFHRKTDWSLARSADGFRWVLLVGTPLDIEESDSSLPSVTNRALNLFVDNGRQSLVEYVAYLGGRFIAFFGGMTEISVLPDCHASLASYWTESSGHFIASSHSKLTADLAQVDIDKQAIGLVSSPEYNDAGGRYYPGVLTPYENVRPLIANCMLNFELLQRKVTHKRFYPWKSIDQKSNLDTVFREFSNVLERHVGLMTQLGKTNISLTAGLDSRTVLQAIRGRAQRGSYTYTYFRFEDSVESTIEDLMGAGESARSHNIQHKILRLKPYDQADSWVKEYVKTFPKGSRFPALANCYRENFNDDDISLISTIAETGTVFYAEREDAEISAKRLAGKFTYTKINTSPDLIRIFDEYIDFTQFYKHKIYDIDYHDLFYWEHRNSKWANIWYSELDLSHRVLLPFNSRRLIELMLSIPFELRKGKYLLNRYIENK